MADLPKIVWLGKKTHEWVIECFGGEDGGEDRARRWAAEGTDQPGNRRIFWSVAIPEDTVIYRAHPVPATTRIEQVGGPRG